MCDIKSLSHECGRSNAPGTRTVLYAIPSAELVGNPKTKFELDPLNTEPGDKVTLGEDFTYVATVGLGYWRQYPIVTNTGQVTDELQGEVGGRSFLNSIAFFIAGLEADRLEFAACVANSCMVFAIRDREGIMRVIGRSDDPAFVEEINLDTGLQVGDRRGGAYLVQSTSGAPALIYDDEEFGFKLEPNAM